ncbi:GumC domain-containing protein [Nitritalea halalkaliphila]|nr:hypothetical protein [Nitritalea halalkaliphila]
MQDLNPKRPSESLSTHDIRRIWRQHRLAYLLVCGLALALAVAVHFLRPKSYRAEALLLVSSADQMGASPNLGGLAALTGFSLPLNPNQNEVPPSLYPKLASETSFLQQLLPLSLPPSTLADFPGGTLESLLDARAAKGLWPKAENQKPSRSLFRADSTLSLSQQEVERLKRLEKALQLSWDPQENTLLLQADMPDPEVALRVLEEMRGLLQKRLIDIRAGQAQNRLDFTEKRWQEAEKAFFSTQEELATFRIENQNRVSPSLNNRLERLEARYNLRFETYSELGKQVELARLQVARDTPNFTLLRQPEASYRPLGPGLLLRGGLHLIAAAFLIVCHSAFLLLRLSGGAALEENNHADASTMSPASVHSSANTPSTTEAAKNNPHG